MFSIIMDDVTYHLRARYETISRSFRIKDGENAGDMLSGLYRRDMVGTYYDYEIQVEPDPQYPLDYDNFYQAISAPEQLPSRMGAMQTAGRQDSLLGRQRLYGWSQYIYNSSPPVRRQPGS